MKGTVHYETQKQVAILTLDNPPVNPLSSGIRQGLADGMVQAQADDDIKAIVITGAGNAFIAGADISEFGQTKLEGASLGTVMQQIESSSKPVVSAINGVALGGGLEVALCTNFRLASPSARVGLPEVNLGLLPGAGGTQRLPRLIGLERASTFMISGTPAKADEALKLGIVDEIVPENLLEYAIEFALKKAAAGELPKVRDNTEALEKDAGRIDEILEPFRQLANRTRRGQEAPMRILDCIKAAATTDFDAGLKVESEAFIQCLTSKQRESMIHIFFSQRQAARIPDVPSDTNVKTLERATVIGSGTMGGGIAMCFANSGIPVTVIDQDEKNLKRGIGVIEKNYSSQVARKRISQAQMDRAMALISASLNYDSVAQADIIIEAVYENLNLKQDIFKRLDQDAKPDAILATNTSALNIDAIASATSRPESVIGTHFFSPANVMQLLEVVRGKESSKETIASAMTLGKKLRKIPVLARNCPGFIGNRMLAGYSRQAGTMLLEGALPVQIDKVMYEFGMPMGPMQMADLVGLDLGWRARKMAGGSNELTARIPDAICELGHYGQKSGQGFYKYEAGSRTPIPSEQINDLIVQISEEMGYKRREISDDEILQRCVYPLINEGARILEEGIAIRSSDIDVVYVFGYGFPIWRGGPMHYANSIGLDQIQREITALKELTQDDFWTAAPLLQKLASEKGNFS
ncbi:MAG: 3-hydroxyacyl-CoA dehydrogenase NAD-binding domain-containing protein [Gammaproteobacteria bacterium]